MGKFVNTVMSGCSWEQLRLQTALWMTTTTVDPQASLQTPPTVKLLNPASPSGHSSAQNPEVAPSSGHFEGPVPQSPRDAGFDRFTTSDHCVRTGPTGVPRSAAPPSTLPSVLTISPWLASCSPRGLQGRLPREAPFPGH